MLVSCYGNSYNSTTGASSNLKFRVFVSNPLAPGVGGGGVPVLNIIDATKDVLSFSTVNMSGSNDPGLMAVAPDKLQTLVFSDTTNTVAVINNATESGAGGSNGQALPLIQLQGPTKSLFVSKDNTVGYAAVPTAAVLGQNPGAVQVFSLVQARTAALLPVSHVASIVQSHTGTRVLAFGGDTCNDGTDPVVLIAVADIGSNQDPRTFICGFDHPVAGVFSNDDATAYVFNCGPECHGTSAGVAVLDLNSNTITATIPVPGGATAGLLNGSTVYVAGSAPGTPCGSGTMSTSCGTLSVVDVGSLTVTNSVLIADGSHDRVIMGANGRIFIGASHCTNINVAPSGGNPGEVRGCLSIFNTQNSTAIVPPVNGDVTGIEPITNRNVVYVAQSGELFIYDTTTDQLQAKQIDIIGKAMDVVLVDNSSQ